MLINKIFKVSLQINNNQQLKKRIEATSIDELV